MSAFAAGKAWHLGGFDLLICALCKFRKQVDLFLKQCSIITLITKFGEQG